MHFAGVVAAMLREPVAKVVLDVMGYTLTNSNMQPKLALGGLGYVKDPRHMLLA